MIQTCINCEVEFGERRNQNGRGKFCSTECHRAHNKLTILTFREFLKDDPEQVVRDAINEGV